MRKTMFSIDELRKRTERIISLPREEFQKISVGDTQALMGDLLLSLIELESNIEGLRFARVELEESRQQCNELFDFAPIGYFNLDPQGNVSNVNFTAGDMLGVSRDAIVNKPFLSLVQPQYHEAFHNYLKKMSETGFRLSLEVQMRRQDGSTFFGQLHGVALSEKLHISYRVSVSDITDRKKAEEALRESENRLRSTFDAMLEGCVILDFNWRYLYANDAALRLGRRTVEQRIGHTLMEVFPGIEKQETFAHLKRCMETRTPERYVTQFIFPEGGKAWFEVRAEPVPEGILVLYISTDESSGDSCVSQQTKKEPDLPSGGIH